MGLPFNSYNQMRYHGNEYVTDQTLNRTVYRLFQNDVYLDNSIQDHINNDSVHYTDSDDSIIDYLTSDKQIVLAARDDGGVLKSAIDVISDANLGIYSMKSWQRLINEQPKNLGGNTLSFRFQQAENIIRNPDTMKNVFNADMLDFSNFYGGTLIIESPAAYDANYNTFQNSTSAMNQRLIINSNHNANSIINVENCHCNVIIRNCHFKLLGISNVTSIGNNGTDDWSAKDGVEGVFATKAQGTVYQNTALTSTDDGSGEMKRYSAILDKWFDLNMLSAVRITKCPNVSFVHCCIEYYKN